MRINRVGAALIAAGLIAGVASAPSAEAGQSASNAKALTGVLVWTQFVDIDFSAARIAIADADGTHERPLSHPPSGYADIDAEVSPDGTRVAYERDFPDGQTTEIRVTGVDGSGDHAIDLGCAKPCEVDLTPAWTPDGRHLVFTRVVGPFDPDTGNAVSAVLFKTDLSGDHIVRVSQGGIDGVFEDGFASFAPAGYLVFVRTRNADFKNALFRMNLDGSHLIRLTPWSLIADVPDVSHATSGPTRNVVVFETYGHGPPDGKSQAIATVSATCCKHKPRHIHYLTSPSDQPRQAFNPSWSPDGRHIAYTKFSFDETAQVVHGDIWTMLWNGRHKRPAADSDLFDFRPDWGPAPQS